MPDRHKTTPLSIRLPDAERSWVQDRAQRTGRSVRQVILDAIRLQRELAADDPGAVLAASSDSVVES